MGGFLTSAPTGSNHGESHARPPVTHRPVAGQLPRTCPWGTHAKLASAGPRRRRFELVSRPEREHKRYAHDVAVTFRLGAQVIEGRTRNVSRGGLCANVADAVAMGTDLDVEIVLVFDDGMQSEALRLPCRVAWCTTLDDAHQLGVAFRALDKTKVEYLTMFLDFLDDQHRDRPARDLSIDDRFR